MPKEDFNLWYVWQKELDIGWHRYPWLDRGFEYAPAFPGYPRVAPPVEQRTPTSVTEVKERS